MVVFSVLSSSPDGAYAQKVASTSKPLQKHTMNASLPLSSSSAITSAKVLTVKITSPTKNEQVPISRDLLVSGTSSKANTTANSNNDYCKVSIRVNKKSPYQPANSSNGNGHESGETAANNDYSKWTFVLTSNYTTIKPGHNRITAKYECANNPALTSFSSVNVTGVLPGAATKGPATTSATASDQRTNAALTKLRIGTHNPNASAEKEMPQEKPTINTRARVIALPTAVDNVGNNSSSATIAPHVIPMKKQDTATNVNSVKGYNTNKGKNSVIKTEDNPKDLASGSMKVDTDKTPVSEGQRSDHNRSISGINSIKIVSPARGDQLHIGSDLVISGKSSYSTSNNCKVYVGVNSFNLYRLAKPDGPGGVNDYSRWYFKYTPSSSAFYAYTPNRNMPITPAPYYPVAPGSNMLVAKLACDDNSNVVQYDSISIEVITEQATAESNGSFHAINGSEDHGSFSSIPDKTYQHNKKYRIPSDINDASLTNSHFAGSSDRDDNVNHHKVHQPKYHDKSVKRNYVDSP